MTDEIDLLRSFRADTPEPSEEAWEKARAAIALAPAVAPAAELPEPAESPPDPGGPHRLGNPGRRRPGRRPRRRVLVATLIGVAAALVAAVLVTVAISPPPPTLAGPATTAWQPARPLPAGGSATGIPATAHAPSGTWRLAAYLVSQGWQTSTAGPEPGPLTCPTAATCYVEGDDAKSDTGPADMRTLYVSTDGARSWSALPVPDGVTWTSTLACASATACAAGGLYYGHQAVYLTTADGGHSWAVRPLAAAVGQVLSLTCATATSCQGLAAPADRPVSEGFDGTIFDSSRVVTADGGRHFTIQRFPAGDAIQSVACPTATHCVAVGVPSHFTQRDGPDFTHAILLTSDDGGRTWRRHAWPQGYGMNFPPALSCQDATHCSMLGYVMKDGTDNEGDGMVVKGNDAIQYSVVAFSADGGATWTGHVLPNTIRFPRFGALDCPTVRTCYASGSAEVGQRIGATYNADSPLVAFTGDACGTWHQVTFTAPATVPAGMPEDSFMNISQLQCPQADACIGLGMVRQGQKSTPVYTNHG